MKYRVFSYTENGDFFFPYENYVREETNNERNLAVAFSTFEDGVFEISFSYTEGESTVGFRLTVTKEDKNLVFTVSQLDTKVHSSIRYSNVYVSDSESFIRFLSRNCIKLLSKLSKTLSNDLLSHITEADIIKAIKLSNTTYLLTNDFSNYITTD